MTQISQKYQFLFFFRTFYALSEFYLKFREYGDLHRQSKQE